MHEGHKENSARPRREATIPPRRPREEAIRLGKEIYERDILPHVEADHFGEYVAIDIETGDWAGCRYYPCRGGASAGAAPRGCRCLVRARRLSVVA